MAENPIEAAGNELKNWLEQLKKIMAMIEANEKAMKAEQKAIGDKALAANKEMVAKTKHDELMKELKDIKQGIKNTPDGTPGKDAALKDVAKAQSKLGGMKGPSGGKQSTGAALGWTKSEKGWQNEQGQTFKQMSTIKMGSAIPKIR